MATVGTNPTPAFQWNDAYALGIPEIDAQHRGFLEMANAFLDLASSGRTDQAALQSALNELVAYGQNHFATEEGYMDRVNFPDEEKRGHLDLHNAFVLRANELAKRFRRGDATLPWEIVAFMCDWLIQHIMRMDVRYAQYFRGAIVSEHYQTLVPTRTPAPAAPAAPEVASSGPSVPPVAPPQTAPSATRLLRPATPSARQQIAGVPDSVGSYRILQQLGQGGMGAVYKAVHTTLERPVAIKMLPPELADSPEHVSRFLREARVVAGLRHPHIVTVYDAGEANGRYYIAMELIEGQSLAGYIEKQGLLKEAEALEFLAQSLQGLAAAHAEGLVHRDIKPDNLLLDRKGQIHIADFGLVMEVSSTSCLTMAGTVMGTPQYISPEQADGEKVDERTDLYSLGATFYRALVGQIPFQAPSVMSMLFKHKYERPVPPKKLRPELSESVNRLILWLMGKRREDRPPNAAAVLQMIEAIRRGESIPLPPMTGTDTTPSL